MADPGLLLTLDRGNTTLDAMLHPMPGGVPFGDGEPVRARLDPGDPDALAMFLGQRVIRAAIGVSVVPAGLASAQAWLSGHGVDLLGVPDELACPMPSRYETMATLGADRWVAAWGAHRLVGAAVVVDCGTAVTVDGVDAAGTFLGGAIAPGPAALAVGLRAVAPGLPEAESNWKLPPVRSAEAVGAGLELGLCGLVERLVAEIRATLVDAEPALLITGGAAHAYLRHGRLEFRHEPDLVHQGLCGLWREHLR